MRLRGVGKRVHLHSEAAVREVAQRDDDAVACDDAKSVVPWLGTRSAGMFCTSHRPVKV